MGVEGPGTDIRVTTTAPGWTRLTISFKATASSHPIVLYSSAGAATFYVDDASIQEIQAKDASANGNHGTLSGAANTEGPTIGVTGKLGTAYDFDGVDDFVSVPQRAGAAPSGSIEVQAKSTVGNDGQLRFIYDGGAASGVKGVGLTKESDGILKVYFGDGTVLRSISDTVVIPINSFFHAIVSWDAAGVRLYKNGALVASSIIVPAISLEATGYVGSHEGALRYWSGVIDEVRIYGSALTPEELYVMKLA